MRSLNQGLCKMHNKAIKNPRTKTRALDARNRLSILTAPYLSLAAVSD